MGSQYGGAGGGKLRQVQSVSVTSETNTTSTSYTGVTGASIAFTPTKADSIIEIEYMGRAQANGTGKAQFQIHKDDVDVSGTCDIYPAGGTANAHHMVSISHREAAGDTTARTYNLEISSGTSGQNASAGGSVAVFKVTEYAP